MCSAACLVNSSFAMVGALRRTRPTTGERAGRVPIGALQAAAQGSRARQSTVRELSIPMVRDRMATKTLGGARHARNVMCTKGSSYTRVSIRTRHPPRRCRATPVAARPRPRVPPRASPRLRARPPSALGRRRSRPPAPAPAAAWSGLRALVWRLWPRLVGPWPLVPPRPARRLERRLDPPEAARRSSAARRARQARAAPAYAQAYPPAPRRPPARPGWP